MASRPTSRCSSGSCATRASRPVARTSTTWRSAWPNARTSRSRWGEKHWPARHCRAGCPDTRRCAGQGHLGPALPALSFCGRAGVRQSHPPYAPRRTHMPYLELSLRSTEAEQPRYERALEDVGALSVTLLDADADTPNERAILEPGVGQTPVWKSLVLTALFDADADALALLAALEAFDPELDWSTAGFRTVEDQDWERVW